jgi:DNA-binding NarL/FixJ family response regulator
MNLDPKRISVVLVAESDVRAQACFRLWMDERLRVVGEASHPREAIFVVRRCIPDVVVVDAHLANGSILDVLSDIKISAPHCAVILLSAPLPSPLRQQYERSGADYFVNKTNELDSLFDVLSSVAKSVIRKQSLASATPNPNTNSQQPNKS